MHPLNSPFILLSALMLISVPASSNEDLEQLMDGFDDAPVSTPSQQSGSANNPTNSQTPTINNDLSDLDESGFDDEAVKGIADESTEKEKNYTLAGYTSLLGAYNYAQKSQSIVAPGDMPMDFSGLSRTRIKGSLTLEMKHGELNGRSWQSRFEIMGWYDAAWSINGREDYTEDVLDVYESFIDLKDAYIQGSLTDSLDLKFGRQIVIWGKSDSIRITDIINPLDNREPGMVDIEDLRLNELMTRMDYYTGNWGVSAMVIHEPRLEIEAAFGSDYRPSDIFGSPIPYDKFPDRIDPDWSADNTQYAMSLDGRFTGWDLSLYAANVFDNRFDVEEINDTPIRFNEKTNMLGIAANLVSGSWLFKSEAAYFDDINYRSTEPKNRLDMLIGFDYNGLKNTIISLELADRHIFDYEDQMLTLTLEEAAMQQTFPDFVRQDTLQMALRGSYSFNHDNATANYLVSLIGGNGEGGGFDGGFQRLWIDYKYSDTTSINAGLVDYIGGNGLIPFYDAIKNNDRIFAEVQYNF